ncbi:1-phosphatidylinositol-3-phosphate 5-kinase [Clonorchis sinensis]|uniref:1-phosphatidylinositol-3-phosphate 5-kinase n=1 Tax=Clonorchis sinensis TaxID=79923 RepID=G7YKU0_CLOSI|nr:1-phosphatidylinositol-3-phosphate 5-kinase [Clonorchis sinensis]
MEDTARYVTLGEPEFEKKDRGGGFFRKFLAKFKSLYRFIFLTSLLVYDGDAPLQKLSCPPNADSQSIDERIFKVCSSKRTESSDTWSDTTSVQESNAETQPSLMASSFTSHGSNITPLRRIHMPFNLNAAAISSLAETRLSDDRRYWMLDESCRHCFECGSRFNAIRRRHHCRICGRIFCHQCSNQFVEGHQIGMSGLQRVCSYCARALPSASPLTLSRVGSAKHVNWSPRGVEACAGTASVSAVHDNSTSSPLSADATLCRGTAEEQHNATLDCSTGTQLTSNTEDLLGFGRLLSPAGLRKQSVPVPTMSSGSVGGRINRVQSARSRQSVVGSSTLSNTPHQLTGPCGRATSDASVMTSLADLPQNVCGDASHSHDSLDEVYIRELWSRMLSTYLAHRVDNPALSTPQQSTVPKEGRLDTESFELTWLGLNPRILQLVAVVHNDKTIYCISGLSLVYWLASNVPEVQRCREMARPICQRFMDLSLLVPLGDPSLREFRDDFTPYEVRQVRFPLTNATKFANFGLDEPEWLREIADGTDKQSRSGTAYLLCLFIPFNTPEIDDYSPCFFQAALAESSSFEVGEDVRLMNYATDDSTPLPAAASCGLKTILSLYGSETDMSSNQPFSRTRPSAIPSKPASKQLAGTTDFGATVKRAFHSHIQRFVTQDARDNHLDLSWVPVLIDLAHAVCNVVNFDIRSSGLRPSVKTVSGGASETSSNTSRPVYSTMDIRYYVHVKKLLDDSNQQSEIFPGVIFTKRAAHKFMSNLINEPRILLLASSIDYQRMPSKITWLESQIMQEEEYLSNCVSKLLALRPKVIIVGGSVSHVAKTLLLKAGITLFCNVKRSVLIRIARITGADILESVDRLISTNVPKSGNASQRVNTPQLGVSQQLKVEQAMLPNGYSKFLTLIKNASKDSVATLNSTPSDPSSQSAGRYATAEATVLLRGSDLAVLNRAKRCLMFTLYLCYNSRLEQSYAANAFIYHPVAVRSIGLFSDCGVLHQRQASTGSSAAPVSDDPTKQEVLSLCSSFPFLNQSYPFLSCPLRLSTLLENRLFDISPSVTVPPPFLASTDGQVAPLAAYYTYVIEWPFGRRLNDLLKRKAKVLRSELYVLEQMKRLQKIQCTEWSTSGLPEFLTCNLKSRSTELIKLLTSCPAKRSQLHNCGVMDKSINLNALLMSETLQPEDETAYVMFKTRAFTTQHTENEKSVLRNPRSFSTDLLELMSVEKDCLTSIRQSFLGVVQHQPHQQQSGKAAVGKPSSSSDAAPAVSRNEIQQVKRLQRSILDPRSQQWFSFLTTLFSFKSPLWPEPCVPPWIASVEYYGPQDLPLGLFLEKCCFSQQPCRHPHCNWPMIEHMQPFVQTSGAVQLYIRKIPQDPPRPTCCCPSESSTTRPDSRILMWLACTICGTNSPTVFMTGDTWHYSFVKFLNLLINTPSEWGRCAMRPLTTTNNAPESSTVPFRQDDRAPSVSACQLACPHSAHKALQHCFCFDRKVAVFRYQPTTVYELVMPPNEVHIHPSAAQAAISRLCSLIQRDTLEPPTESAESIPPREETRCRNLKADRSQVTDLEAPIPAYLRDEALEILEKYYHTYAAVKAHLITLQQDNLNPEFTPLLQSYIHLLQTHCRRNHMEIRAELLTYLINTKVADAVCAGGRNPSTESADLPFPTTRALQSAAVSDTHVAEQETQSINSVDYLRATSGSVLSRITTDNIALSSFFSCVWNHPAERCYIAQSLMNDLKRWIYGFVACWNSKCADYEAQLKRAEKQAKELRKKLTNANPGGTQSPSMPVRQLTANQLGPTLAEPNTPDHRGIRSASSSVCFYTLPAVGQWPDTCDRATTMVAPAIAQDAGTEFYDYGSDASVNQDTNLPDVENDTAHLRVAKPAVMISPDPTSEQSCSDILMLSSETLGSSLPAETSVHGGNLGSQDLLSVHTQEDDIDVTSAKPAHLPTKTKNSLHILDPLNLKVIYNPMESAHSTSNPGSPVMSGRMTSPKVAEMTVLAAASAATVPLNAPSGVRRFIHTLLPSNNEAKIFDDPFPPNEHPQLSLSGEISSSIFQQSRYTSALLDGGERDPRSLDYRQSLIQHLRLAAPDVYVNDHELTSIVAYALSTTEYERHLVDLHTEATSRNSVNVSLQMGQSALSELGEIRAFNAAGVNLTRTDTVGPIESMDTIISINVSNTLRMS